MVLLQMLANLIPAPLQVPQIWSPGILLSHFLQSLSVGFLLKYVLLCSVLLFVCIRFLRQRAQMVALIDRIPGPPVHPWFPWLGHALLVLDLDRCKFQYGTYARE